MQTRLSTTLWVLALLSGCSDELSAIDAGPNPTEPEPPIAHRAQAVQCDTVREPARCDMECEPEARCASSNGSEVVWCSYDECFTDEDCGRGKICECGGGFASDNNICVVADCRTDADCGDSYCSPSFGECGDHFGVVGYYCHTDQDECVDDADCKDVASYGFCGWDAGVGHWRCSTATCDG